MHFDVLAMLRGVVACRKFATVTMANVGGMVSALSHYMSVAHGFVNLGEDDSYSRRHWYRCCATLIRPSINFRCAWLLPAGIQSSTTVVGD